MKPPVIAQSRRASRHHPPSRRAIVHALDLACVALSLLCFGPAVASAADAKTDHRFVPANRRLGQQLATSFDAGDTYPTPSGPRKLRRLAGTLAIDSASITRSRRAPDAAGEALAGYVVETAGSTGLTVYSATQPEKLRQLLDPKAAAAVLKQARKSAATASANPVFVDPATGLRLLATEQLVIRLKPGVSAEAYFGGAWKNTQPLWGTTDQFILTLKGATAEDVLAEVSRRARDPQVVWAEPDFMSEVVRCFTPNDPYFSTRQWHLNNTGQSGGTPGADVRLTAAWDLTNGNPNVVVAIIDDGTQLNHPDLAGNLFQNAGENPINRADDDLNGFADDVHGWDFIRSDADPSPESPDDNHGTAVSGVVAAVGNNGTGISGAAPGCRLLPIKIISGDFSVTSSGMSRAIRYAAGLGANGAPLWRGADILNLSLVFSPGLIAESAFQDALTKGRGGKGCPIFVAAGNSASAWQPFDFLVTNAANYTLRWEYSKDESDVLSVGDDTVWLDSISWPDGTHETFEAGVPTDWTSSATAPWTAVTDGINGNRAMLGWNGPGSRSLRAGRIGHSRTTFVETTRFLTPGVMRFWFWVSSEHLFDYFTFRVNGVEKFSESGVPILTTQVDYPANLPQAIAVGASTDFDFRADYSQYGTKLDFVTPSDGGASGIFTTDRSAAEGYNNGANQDGDYVMDFGGTSSATPLASGIAALVLSMNPYLTAAEVRALLRETCDKVGGVSYDAAGRNSFYGSGRLNAARALQNTRAALDLMLSASPEMVTQADLSTYTIAVRNTGPARSGPLLLSCQLPANVAFGSATPAPATRSGNLLTFNAPTLAKDGTAVFRVTVTNLLPGTDQLLASVSSDIPEDNLADNAASLGATVLPAPVVSINDAQVLEGSGAPAGRILFNVALDRPSSRVVSVAYATVTNSAGRADFRSASGTVTFQPGQVAAQVFVDTVSDLLDENDEALFLQLTKPVNAILGNARATGTILDDDAPPLLLLSGRTVREGNSGARLTTFIARLSAASGRTVTVDFNTRSGTAAAGGDYLATNGTLRFPPGNKQQRFAVAIVGDTIHEGTESFDVVLSNPANVTLSQSEYAVTILDNERPPRISINDTSVAEGDAGGTDAVFNVRLDAPSALPVHVGFTATNGSAQGGSDFVATSGVITIAPGETNVALPIQVVGDSISESNEFFSVRLFSATNATVSDALGRATIIDNDPLPVLAINDVLVQETVAGATNAVFAVALTPASGRTVTIRFATSGGTATSGADFVARSGSVTFLPGITNGTIAVAVNRDALTEPEETFFVTLHSPVNATLLNPQATGIILPPGALMPIAPAIAEARFVNTKFSLRFATESGVHYRVECSHSVTNEDWIPLPGAEDITGTGEFVEVFDENSITRAKCFYRVRVLP